MSFLSLQRNLVRQYGALDTMMFDARLAIGQWRASRSRHRYKHLDIQGVSALRRGDRVFVFGSGYSLNDIDAVGWAHIAVHETLGFNAFVRQRWVRADFHLIRGWGEGASVRFDWRRACKELGGLIAENPFYSDTTFAVQADFLAEIGNRMIGDGFLPEGARIFRYTTDRTSRLPTARFEDGLSHGNGTLCDAVNFAYLMGWRQIVLVGVDLYDTRYFFLPPDQTLRTDYTTGRIVTSDVSDRGQRWDQPHSTFTNGAIELFRDWTKAMKERGVELAVWNPRSLLCEVMPVYRFEGAS